MIDQALLSEPTVKGLDISVVRRLPRTGKFQSDVIPIGQRSTSFETYYGSEFTANAVRSWVEELGVATLYFEPGSPWENGYDESFIGKLRDELLSGEVYRRKRRSLSRAGEGNTIAFGRIAP